MQVVTERLRGALAPMARPLVASLVGVDTDEPVVAFTFDDGPDPACTPLVLDALRDAGARATFFVLGEAARRHPALVQRAVGEGHEIALHGESHRAILDLPAPSRIATLVRGRRSVRATTGSPPRWFRAPYGKQTAGTVLASRALGMQPVMWSVYAREWEELAVGECVAFAARGLRPGAIVLLHDGAAGEGDAESARPTAEVVEIVRALLGAARERGLRAVPVGELLAAGTPRRRVWLRSWRVDDD